MNENIPHIFKLSIEYLNVGSPLQNILFYSFVLTLLLINIFLVRRKRDRVTNIVAIDDNIKIDQLALEDNLPSRENLIQRSKDLEEEIASLKTELLALGEELELSYNRSDKLNYQLTEILECLDLTVPYHAQLWDWSIDVNTNELTFSEYGLQVRGHFKGTKQTWMDALPVVDDEYRKQVETALILSLKTGADFSMRYKINPVDGSQDKWINSVGRMIYSSGGIPLRLEGKFFFKTSDH